jgi:putative transposase
LSKFQNKYRIESNRLPGWDYSGDGKYFLTICTHDKLLLFGNIYDGNMIKNQFGNIAHYEWLRSFEIRPDFILDEFIIMPNHVHGIVKIKNSVLRNGNIAETHCSVSLRQQQQQQQQHKIKPFPYGRKPKSISSFVAGYKSTVTKQINIIRRTPGQRIWQPNYHDIIIRNENQYHNIQRYIINNPKNWVRKRKAYPK